MKPSSRHRTSSKLSDSLHHQLNMYALAASAAGVGILALSQPAHARIVHTKTNVKIFKVYPGFPLDLNHDGIKDFRFVGFSTTRADCDFINRVNIAPASPNNGIWVRSNYAAALHIGVTIGPRKAHFDAKPLIMGIFSVTGDCGNSKGHYRGPWENDGKGVTNRYLGLKFKIEGKTHYGWARLTFPGWPKTPLGATLTGYAYETIPGKAIIAGATRDADEEPTASFNTRTHEPATLAMLALGAPGLSIWKREESVFAAPGPNKF
jgi:hypothetical protein